MCSKVTTARYQCVYVHVFWMPGEVGLLVKMQEVHWQNAHCFLKRALERMGKKDNRAEWNNASRLCRTEVLCSQKKESSNLDL